MNDDALARSYVDMVVRTYAVISTAQCEEDVKHRLYRLRMKDARDLYDVTDDPVGLAMLVAGTVRNSVPPHLHSSVSITFAKIMGQCIHDKDVRVGDLLAAMVAMFTSDELTLLPIMLATAGMMQTLGLHVNAATLAADTLCSAAATISSTQVATTSAQWRVWSSSAQRAAQWLMSITRPDLPFGATPNDAALYAATSAVAIARHGNFILASRVLRAGMVLAKSKATRGERNKQRGIEAINEATGTVHLMHKTAEVDQHPL